MDAPSVVLVDQEELAMLVVLAVAEQRLRAVLEVLDGATVTEVARRFGVTRRRQAASVVGDSRA